MKLSECGIELEEMAQEMIASKSENERWIEACLTASKFFQHDPRQMLAVWLFVGSLLAIVAGLVLLTVGVVQGFTGSSECSSACLFASALCWALALVLTKFTEKH